jgi:hypothetical protein
MPPPSRTAASSVAEMVVSMSASAPIEKENAVKSIDYISGKILPNMR